MNDKTQPQGRYNDLEAATGPVLHIRYEGTSRDIPIELLRIAAGASDTDIRTAVAQYLDIGLDRLTGYVVERHATGNLTLRPEAVFG